METFHWYRGFGIRYIQIIGTTYVELLGDKIAVFPYMGATEGEKLAHEYVDNTTDAK
jgi:hypothetical protein